MNVSILKKCLDELSKENPKLDYVRGMLETLIDIQDAQRDLMFKDVKSMFVPKSTTILLSADTSAKTDEGSILDATAAAKIQKIKAQAEQSS